MTTKHYCLSLKDKQKIFVNNFSNGKYNNFNLGQNQRYSNLNNIRSKSVGIEGKNLCQNFDKFTDFKNSQSFNPWKKFDKSSNSSKIHKDSVKDELEEKIYDSNNATPNNNSTLSLHIEAYENSFKASQISQNVETMDFQNPFEFPRQQNDETPRPKVSQFKASQKLHNPNKLYAATNKSPKS
uniref:Exophilin 5 n=1 Tax=Panagrolaimus sp. PS1159 TaxID=55785 RepID=A0AC35GNB0_9BILA